MVVRPITPADDRLAVSRIYAESWRFAYRGIVPQAYLDALSPEHWCAAPDTPGRYTLVLEADGALVGTSSYCASRQAEYAGGGEIISIYLLPEAMGRGYGRQLLETAVQGLRRLGYEDIFLWVLEKNLSARAFYEKMGFVQSDSVLDVTIGGETLREVRYCHFLREQS